LFSQLFDRSATAGFRPQGFAGGSAPSLSAMSDQALAHEMRELEDLKRDLSQPDQQHLPENMPENMPKNLPKSLLTNLLKP
jgi:hypothetical protein